MENSHHCYCCEHYPRADGMQVLSAASDCCDTPEQPQAMFLATTSHRHRHAGCQKMRAMAFAAKNGQAWAILEHAPQRLQLKESAAPHEHSFSRVLLPAVAVFVFASSKAFSAPVQRHPPSQSVACCRLAHAQACTRSVSRTLVNLRYQHGLAPAAAGQPRHSAVLELHQQLRVPPASRQHFLGGGGGHVLHTSSNQQAAAREPGNRGCNTAAKGLQHLQADTRPRLHRTVAQQAELLVVPAAHSCITRRRPSPHITCVRSRGQGWCSPPVPPCHCAALVAARQAPALALHAAVGAAHNHAPLRHHVVAVAAAVRAPRRHLQICIRRAVTHGCRGTCYWGLHLPHGTHHNEGVRGRDGQLRRAPFSTPPSLHL